MKKIFRMLLFPGIALILTSFWNKGFSFSSNYSDLIKLFVFMSIIYYLLVPLSKIVLFPINLLTFGLATFLVLLLSFYLLNTYFHLISISAWQFSGVDLLVVKIQKTEIGYGLNLILSSLSVSSIINILDKIL